MVGGNVPQIGSLKGRVELLVIQDPRVTDNNARVVGLAARLQLQKLV